MSDYIRQNVVVFEDLKGADLHIDAKYMGGTVGNLADEPLSKLIGVGNAGGFRPIGRVADASLPETISCHLPPGAATRHPKTGSRN